MKSSRCGLIAVALGAVVGAGCGDDEQSFGHPDCDPIHTARCAMPWPSNLYLEEDDTRATGHTLAFGETSLPANTRNVHPEPEAYRDLDGYGVGSSLLVSFPNVDTSEMASETDIGPSVEADSPIVWLEVDESGAVVDQIPHWAELDAHAAPEEQTLFVRPAVLLEEGTRYVVAFRNLRTTSGEPIQPEPAFVKLREGRAGDDPQLGPRQARFDEVFEVLEGEGIAREELVLAWDFVTASCDGLHGRMLQVRDQGLDAVGPMGPELTIGDVTVHDEADEPDVYADVRGTFEVPSFLAEDTIHEYTSMRLSEDAEGNVTQNGWREADFWLRIPRSAVDGDAQELMIYGHGLLGRGSQVTGSFNGRIGNEYGIIPFATDWTGMADTNLLDAANALNDLSRFPFMADQLHQGLLDFVLLARGMRERLQTALDDHPDTAGLNVTVSTDPDDLYYSGISQGGIFGASVMALTPDMTYGHLGVPGNNYTMLLQRSVDFDFYAGIMRNAYPDPMDQVIGLSLIGLLWEMTEPVSYLRHLSADPFPGNDPHHVILAAAKGDWQVANVTNEVAARSDVGIALMENYGRPVWDTPETPYPHEGSGLVMYDFGNPWPEPGNITPDDEIGDPHGKPRYEDHHNQQMVDFFRTGIITDVCGGDVCDPD
ncbi:MAG: hypothetical protein ACOCXM_08520 [Myxococcota bacterium]